MKREVTERDFRKEEFLNSKPEDYEFRDDGKIVRKDRWEKGIHVIASLFDYRDFEIDDVVSSVRKMRDALDEAGIEFIPVGKES